MNKKVLIGIIILIGVLFIIFRIIPNKELSKLDKYTLLSDETIIQEFKLKNKKYVLTTYYNSESTYSYNNLLLNDKDSYYFLEKIDKCDMSYLIKDNEIYIHCIGKKGDILRYTIDGVNVKNEILNFSYKNTPNISQIHITVNKIDNGYIYLKSVVKMDDSVKDGEYVKCSLSSKVCEYY